MGQWPELIVHIGPGKTGSTSIQFLLLDNQSVLEACKTAYLGLMLEEIDDAKAYDWCKRGRPHLFFLLQSQNGPMPR